MLIALITLILLYGLKKFGINSQLYNNLNNLINNKLTKVVKKQHYPQQQVIKSLPAPKINKPHPLKIPRAHRHFKNNLKI